MLPFLAQLNINKNHVAVHAQVKSCCQKHLNIQFTQPKIIKRN